MAFYWNPPNFTTKEFTLPVSQVSVFILFTKAGPYHPRVFVELHSQCIGIILVLFSLGLSFKIDQSTFYHPGVNAHTAVSFFLSAGILSFFDPTKNQVMIHRQVATHSSGNTAIGYEFKNISLNTGPDTKSILFYFKCYIPDL